MTIVFALLQAACTGAAKPLPKSLYFLEGKDEGAQVWRLETDGVTRTQVTHEGAGVGDFAVSALDGSIAFTSDNHLFLVDGNGNDRRLVADDSLVDWNAEDAAFRGSIENPVFSPDGRTLAYGFDGLHLYDIKTGTDEHVLTNLGNLMGEPFVFDKEVYVPGPWSPDGSRLLIIMGYYRGQHPGGDDAWSAAAIPEVVVRRTRMLQFHLVRGWPLGAGGEPGFLHAAPGIMAL